MKLKYYLRGIGVGLLVGALLMFAAVKLLGYEKKEDKKTDKASTEATADITTEKAKATTTEKTADTTTETTAEVTTEATTATTTEATTATTTEATTATTTEATTATTTEATTETTTEATTETTEATTETTDEVTTEATTEKPADNNGEVTVTVVRNMYSTEVARMLQDKGIVEDYLDFDSWLDQTGYSTRIRVGDFSFKKGMSYEEIATILTTGHEE